MRGRGAGGRRLDGAPGRSRLHSRIMEESLLSAIHWLLAVLALPSVGLSAIFTVSLVSATCCRSVPSRRCSATSSWRRTCSGRPCWWRRWAIPSAARSAMPWGWPPNARCSAGRKTPHPHESHPDAGPDGHARPLEPARARLAAPHGSAGAAAVLAAGRGRPAVRRGRVAAAVIPCVAYMAIGKFLRYVAMTAGLLWFFRGSSDASDLSENKGRINSRTRIAGRAGGDIRGRAARWHKMIFKGPLLRFHERPTR